MLFSKPKIRPLTFSPEEIVCLQSGNKTQFRRPVKGGRYFSESMDAGKNPGAIHPVLKCPYGQTGDRIWVRETARSEWQRTLESPFLVQTGVQYRADKEYREITAETKHKMFPAKARTTQGDLAWATPVGMPRWASRYLLEISGSRLEKLADISYEDAYEEGILTEVWDQTVVARNYDTPDSFFQFWSEEMDHYVEMNELYRRSYQSLWNQIYGGDSLASNPLVWVVTFKLID